MYVDEFLHVEDACRGGPPRETVEFERSPAVPIEDVVSPIPMCLFHPALRSSLHLASRPPSFFLCFTALIAGASMLLAAEPAAAQLGSNANSQRAPVVYLDCPGWVPGCDRAHFRTEIQFVNWARDPTDADAHVILTSESAGAGGRRYTFDFIGQGEMQGLSDALTYTSSSMDVQAERQDGLTHTLRLGLMRYAVEAGLGGDFEVGFVGRLGPNSEGGSGEGGDAAESGFYDPWNYWVFEVGLSGNLDLRQTSTDTRVNPSFDADRVTENWKLNFSGRLDFRRDRRELSDGTEVRDDRDDWRASALVVRSVTGHVSVGLDAGARTSVNYNRHARVRLAPALEYNYYPYAEANRRQFIGHYAAGFEHSNYIEETMFGVEQETLPLHRLGIQYNAREQWGNAGVGVEMSQYLHDAGFYSMGVGGNLNYRIARGLSLNVSGDAAWVHDDIHIPASAIPDEDILLGRQDLPSAYRYEARIGLSYQWGSAFTNIVNTRFPRSVR